MKTVGVLLSRKNFGRNFAVLCFYPWSHQFGLVHIRNVTGVYKNLKNHKWVVGFIFHLILWQDADNADALTSVFIINLRQREGHSICGPAGPPMLSFDDVVNCNRLILFAKFTLSAIRRSHVYKCEYVVT